MHAGDLEAAVRVTPERGNRHVFVFAEALDVLGQGAVDDDEELVWVMLGREVTTECTAVWHIIMTSEQYGTGTSCAGRTNRRRDLNVQ